MTEPASSNSDGAIVAAVLSGQRERFAAIVERYQGPLMRMAVSRLGRYDWAEDAVQETFLWAFKSLHTYDSQYSFRTWLWTILLNQCRRHYQKAMRQPQTQMWSDQQVGDQRYAGAMVMESDEVPPLVRLMAEERSQALEELLATLPEAQADALRLRFFGGLKFQEIADAMGCSLSSAKNRVRWGLTRMSQLMGAEKAEHQEL